LTDIEIDRINKPYLPLASGAYSISLAKWIIAASLLIAIGLGIYYGGFLLATILISLFLGTIYSLPPFRLKRFYFWAAFCIIVIRGLVVNFGLFLHFNYVLNQSKSIPPVIWMLAGSIFVMSMIIAWFKDIPDMEGDRSYRISTLSLKLGAKTVFLVGNIVLVLLYLFIIVIAYQYPQNWNSTVLMTSHGIFILVLIVMSSRTKPAVKQSMSMYYQFIWLLFFMEYIAFAISLRT
jgi:homogentisate phytyltransferase/homogentisate geranylgeranyltransferase